MGGSMEFRDQIRELTKSFEKIIPNIHTEEATKHSLVMPVLQALGYNIFDPTEVVPEFTADVGNKKHEKADYAIMINGKPLILIEAKNVGADLDPCAGQLTRYFTVTDAKFGILTDGIRYHFYTDIEKQNMMDPRPFFAINLTPSIRDNEIGEFNKFHKCNFDPENIASTALTLKYIGEMKRYLKAQFTEPEEEFVRFFLKKIYSGKITAQVFERLQPMVKRALQQYLNEVVSDKLRDALNDTKDEDEAPVEQEAPQSGIVTTEDEIEGFNIVKAILSEWVSPGDIQYKDTKTYFGVLYQGNSWKWICRLYFYSSKIRIGFRGKDKSEESVYLESIEDLFSLRNRLKNSLDEAMGTSGSE